MSPKIAWIEDDIDIIDSVLRPLRESGFEFVELRSVKKALDSIDDLRSCDLILLDMILPPGGAEGAYGRYPGLPLLRMLRDDYSIKAPVVVLSVVTNEGILDELRELGVVDVLRKPVLPSKLTKSVRDALGR